MTRARGDISADPILFRRAVSNLVANAIAHAPRGEEITIAAERTDAECALSVTNSGPGIAVEYQARIFERFYRTDSARRHSSSSSGLGLAITKSTMDLHRGRVLVNSSVGGPTTFRLVFPCLHNDNNGTSSAS